MIYNMRRAFGMRRHRSAGILRLQLQQLGFAKRLMHDANARPEQHVAPHLPGKITAQMLIRTENDFLVLRNLRENFFSRRTGDDEDRKSTRLKSSHSCATRMQSSA